MARSRTARTMPRRQRVWARQIGTLSPAAGTGSRAQASLDTQFATEFGTTRLPVGTTIGGILVQWQDSQLIARVGTTDHLTFGIGLFDETTAAEVPLPRSEPHANWMWRLQVPSDGGTNTGSSTKFQGGPVRVKAMRRIEALNQRPWFVVENFGSTTYDVAYDISMLLILP